MHKVSSKKLKTPDLPPRDQDGDYSGAVSRVLLVKRDDEQSYEHINEAQILHEMEATIKSHRNSVKNPNPSSSPKTPKGKFLK